LLFRLFEKKVFDLEDLFKNNVCFFQDAFQVFLLASISALAPTIITITYLCIYVVQNGEWDYPFSLIAILAMLSGFTIHFYDIVSCCHNAFDCISSVKLDLMLLEHGELEGNDYVRSWTTDIISVLDPVKPFNGCGFFIINNSLITSFIGATTTYIIVLVQFGLNEESHHESFDNGTLSWTLLPIR